MRGTRYGDFSRFDFDPTKGYTGVLTQQGRVQLDADWNGQREYVQRAIRSVLRDLIEGDWAPPANPGFGLRPVVALRFEGQNRLVLDKSGTLAPGGAAQHTLELWLTWSGGPGVLVDCRAADGTLGYELAIEENGTLVMTLSVRERATGTLRLYSSAPLRAGNSVHLAVVIGDDYAALVVDGRQVARSGHSGVSDLEAPVIVVGGRSAEAPWTAGFRGFIAAIRVWRVARTLAQLAEAGPATQTAETDTTDPGLLAHWTFDAPSGSPLDDTASGRTATIGGGGSPNWQLVDLVIEPGRLYVDGVLCELSEAISYIAQPGVSTELPTSGVYHAYLEVWEETVSPAEDPSLREVALGGLDPSVRTRIATRVRLRDVTKDGDGERGSPPSPAKAPGQLAAEHTGQAVPGNHLYRVEIHESGGLGGETSATFKWSRDNGASLFAVAAGDSPTVFGLVYASGSIAPLAPDDVVEPLVPGAPLDGPAHPLLRVLDVSTTDGQITLDQAPPAGTSLLRRWDNRPSGGATAAVAGAELPVGSDWIALEDGIRVCFRGNHFRRGDYWWIRARMELPGSIDWPQPSGHPQALSPNGPERLSSPLARLSLGDGGIEIDDLRRMTSPVPAFASGPRVWSSDTLSAARPAAPSSQPAQDDEEPAGELDLAVLAGVDDDDGSEPSTNGDGVVETVPPPSSPSTQQSGADGPGAEVEFGASAAIEEDDAANPVLTPDGGSQAEEETAVEVDLGMLSGIDDEDGSAPSTNDEAIVETVPPPSSPTTEQSGADGPGAEVELGAAARIEEDEAASPVPKHRESAASAASAASAEPETAAATAAWSHVGDLEVVGSRLLSVASAAESIALVTEKALFALRVPEGTANQLGQLPGTRHGSQLVALERLLLLVGGGPSDERADGRVLGFDLDVGSWSERAPMPAKHLHPAVTVANGRVHAIGGRTRAMRPRVHGTHHVYDPGGDRWTPAAELPTPRAGAAAAALGDRVHVVGGHGAEHGTHPHVAHESFDVNHGSWRAEPSLPESRHVVSSTEHRGRHVIVLDEPDAHAGHVATHAGHVAAHAGHPVAQAGHPGAPAGHPGAHVVSFDPSSGSWEWLPPIPPNLRDPRIVSHNGHLYVFGTRADGHVEVHELR